MATHDKKVKKQMSKSIILAGDDEKQDLYLCLNECYIYSKPGMENGTSPIPFDNTDIIYETVPEEIIQLFIEDNEFRQNGYYFRTVYPMEGWVYLPDLEKIEDLSVFDEIYAAKKKVVDDRIEQEKKRKEAKKKKKKNDKDGDGDGGGDDQKTTEEDDINEHLQGIDEQKEEKYNNDNLKINPLVMQTTKELEERRQYKKQKLTKLTWPEEELPEINKLMQNTWIRAIVFYFRRHHYLLILTIFVIQAVIEWIIFYDIVSDLALVYELYDSNIIAYTLSMTFIFGPYIIAWTVVSQYSARRLKEHQDSKLWIIGISLFDIAPIGVTLLMLGDLYHWIESTIKPFFYLFTGREIRTISYEELGYYKLRRVSEVFAEAMPQAVLQAVLLSTNICSSCDILVVLSALGSSVFVLCLWIAILMIEANRNSVGFIEYVTVVFQGSFKFVPMLPAIERGTDKGEKVNWTWYKLSLDGVGHLAKAINTPQCKLELLKITKYTLSDLHRFACRYLGTTLNNADVNCSIIVSRMNEEITTFFEEYDIDDSKSLDLNEFVHLCLIINNSVNLACLRSDVFLIYYQLADSVDRQIWLLDLIMKLRGSQEFIGLLDFSLPLQHATETSNFKIISLLMAASYDRMNSDNLDEFRFCVSNAVANGHIREALCLCEHRGVPIVVEVVRGMGLLPMDEDNGLSDPYVRVQIFDDQEKTSVKRETLTPVYNEKILFIVPFDLADALIEAQDLANEGNLRNRSQSEVFDLGDGFIDSPETYAAIDVGQGLVNGVKLPKYCMEAIVNVAAQRYGMNFEYIVGSDMTLKQAIGADPSNEVQRKRKQTENDEKDEAPTTDFIGNASYTTKATSKGQLKVTLRVFDWDKEEEDDYMGAYKDKIDINVDVSKYHETVRKHKLQYLKDGQTMKDAGELHYRVYLNAFQVYKEKGLQAIDEDVEPERMDGGDVLDIKLVQRDNQDLTIQAITH